VDNRSPFLSRTTIFFGFFREAEYIFPRRRTRNHPAKKEKAPDKRVRSYSECRAKQSSAGTAGSAASDQATRN